MMLQPASRSRMEEQAERMERQMEMERSIMHWHASPVSSLVPLCFIHRFMQECLLPAACLLCKHTGSMNFCISFRDGRDYNCSCTRSTIFSRVGIKLSNHWKGKYLTITTTIRDEELMNLLSHLSFSDFISGQSFLLSLASVLRGIF